MAGCGHRGRYNNKWYDNRPDPGGLAETLGIDGTHLVHLRRAASVSIARGEKEITTRTIVHALQLQRAGDLAAGLAAEAFDLESSAPANRREGADRELLLFGDTLDEVVDVVFGKLPEWIADLIQCNNWCPDGSCPCDGAGKLLQCVLYLLVPGGDN